MSAPSLPEAVAALSAAAKAAYQREHDVVATFHDTDCNYRTLQDKLAATYEIINFRRDFMASVKGVATRRSLALVCPFCGVAHCRQAVLIRRT